MAICFRNSRLAVPLPDIVIAGETIRASDTVTSLGLLLKDDMSWQAQCNRISSKVFAGLRSLWMHGNVTSRSTRMLQVKSLLLPHFTYCCEVFSFGLDSSCKRTLTNSLNACTRYASVCVGKMVLVLLRTAFLVVAFLTSWNFDL